MGILASNKKLFAKRAEALKADPGLLKEPRKCRKCGSEFLPTASLYIHMEWVCRPCRRAKNKAWIKSRREQGRPVPSGGKEDPMKKAERAKRYNQTEIVKERHRRTARELIHDPANRWKLEARWRANRKKESGKIPVMPCSTCGNPKAEMHHSDYSKPFEIIWLCRKCHVNIHREMRREIAAGLMKGEER